MNKKEEEILNEIINYYKKNMSIPSIRYLQKLFNYKSTNSIYKYINSLIQKGYLTKNDNRKLLINNCTIYMDKSLRKIKIINQDNKYIHLFLEKTDNYIAYYVNNKNLVNYGINKGDILIIKRVSKINDNEIGLFLIDNKYRVMKYKYKDGFYILMDKEEIVLYKINLIGKVIMLERIIKKTMK